MKDKKNLLSLWLVKDYKTSTEFVACEGLEKNCCVACEGLEKIYCVACEGLEKSTVLHVKD